MFKFLKEKLKKAVSRFSRKVEEEAEIKEEIREEKVEEVKEEVKEEKIEEEKVLEEEVEEEIKKEEEKPVEEVLEEEIKEAEKELEEEKVLEEEKPEVKKEEPIKEIKKEPLVAAGAEEKPKKSFFKRLFGKKEKKEEKVEEVKKEVKPEVKEEIKKELELAPVAEVPEKKGLFKRIKETFTTIKLSEDKFEKLFWELEVVLLESNVAVEVIDKIKTDLKAELTTGKVSRKGVYDLIEDSLRESVESLFMDQHFNLLEEIKKKKEKPYVIAFIGVNGSGKTTTMAKLAHMLLQNKLSVVFAASDTFRAAAIQQLQEHADKLGVKMIKHGYESDPAAVAFDAVKHAKAKKIDVVMIDTAGRLHSNDNLMNELKKLVRVNEPDLKVFVGESITGNDCIEQAKLFNEAVGIDVIILAKADVDEKGGAAVSVSYVTKKPIIYLGTGQKYDDLTEFKPEIIIKNIGL